MIIFFDKLSGEIYGTIDGRVHDESQLTQSPIRPNNVPEDQVDRYVVSYKPLTRIVKQMQYKQMLNPDTLEIEQVEAGEIEVEQGAGLEMDDQFKVIFERVERGELPIQRCKFIVKDGKVVDVLEKELPAIVEPPKPVVENPPIAQPQASINEQLAVMQKQIDALTELVKGKAK